MPPLSAIPNSLQFFNLDRNRLTGNPFSAPMLPTSNLMEGNMLSGPVTSPVSSAVYSVILSEQVRCFQDPTVNSESGFAQKLINGTINFNTLPTALKQGSFGLDLRNNLITGNLAFDAGGQVYTSLATHLPVRCHQRANSDRP
eukprot:TRINITY_DN18374_c0_g1_i1.p1 TRINITY_DN18374_c0_g1~~TRINITY_DN18374_c0_g1_i1.p1  ORF type:complete len:143 (+),score=18.66 TRINITY_DN18374_c0_g1_i1:3-431(+)